MLLCSIPSLTTQQGNTFCLFLSPIFFFVLLRKGIVSKLSSKDSSTNPLIVMLTTLECLTQKSVFHLHLKYASRIANREQQTLNILAYL